MVTFLVVLIIGCAAVSALPADPILSRPEPGPRYQYVDGPDGVHLVDLWVKVSDVQEAARFSPDTQNVYHLFTRQNPIVSQPMLLGSEGLLGLTNYDPRRRTIVILHGWLDSATAPVNAVLVPAFLAAEDLNVIVVDWSAGSGTINYVAAVANTVTSGESVARFVNWLNQVTGTTAASYHIVGHSLGGHQAGIVGRNVNGDVAYITGLDPMFALWNTHEDKFRADDGRYTEVIHTNAGRLGYVATLAHADFYPNGGAEQPGCGDQDCNHHRCNKHNTISALDPAFPLWVNNDEKLRPTDGTYTEVIHTNAGLLGYLATLGDTDFYPNGGTNNPGCDSQQCNHDRAFHFMAESLLTGGFTGRRCATYVGALSGNCILLGNLRMGGLVPKTGSSGIFWLETNASPPFSRG